MNTIIQIKLNMLVLGLTPVAYIRRLSRTKARRQLKLVTGALKTCRKVLKYCDLYENCCAVPPEFSHEYDRWLLMEDELLQRRKLLVQRLPKR